MKTFKYIELATERYCYSVNDTDLIEGTLTVGQLIDVLEQYDRDLPIVLNNDNGYTYGRIGEWDFSEEEYKEDKDEEDEE